MVAGTAASIIRAPGRIVIGPTDLSTVYPYGGTQIGLAKEVEFVAQGTPFRVECEALGEASDILEANKRFSFSCFLRGWDDDAVEQMLAGGYAAGATSQHATFAEPGNVPGASSIGRAVILLFVPDDIVHVNSLLIYRGVPDWTEGAQLAFQRGAEFGIPLTVDCLRDSNGNMLALERFSDLSLT